MADSWMVMDILEKSDILLNISNKQSYSAVPSKIFQMFSIRKPIINVVRHPKDFAKKYFDIYPSVFTIEEYNDKEKLTEADYGCCLKVLEDVGHLVGRSYETDDDQTSDIIYESFVLAGMIYAKREELRDNPVIQSWKALAENEEVFNDQRMGWRKGKNAII